MIPELFHTSMRHLATTIFDAGKLKPKYYIQNIHSNKILFFLKKAASTRAITIALLQPAPSVPGADGACLSTKWRLEAEVRRLDFGEDTSALAQQAEVKHKNNDKQKIEANLA